MGRPSELQPYSLQYLYLWPPLRLAPRPASVGVHSLLVRKWNRTCSFGDSSWTRTLLEHYHEARKGLDDVKVSRGPIHLLQYVTYVLDQLIFTTRYVAPRAPRNAHLSVAYVGVRHVLRSTSGTLLRVP